jgi:integrase
MGKEGEAMRKDAHLYLKNGVWWTRFVVAGRDERESTRCPKSEKASARRIRDERLGRMAEERAGAERLREPLLLGELVTRYLGAESNEYDRERGGEQPGTKRSAETDRSSEKRIFRHLSRDLSAGSVTPEVLTGLAEAIEREKPTPARATRKKTMAFLRGVFSWAADRRKETGIRVSPFALVTKAQRKRLFPRADKRGYVYTPEQLRALNGLLPPYSARVVRFAVHTGMRLREILRLRWGVVDLEAGELTVLAQYAKNGRARAVALGDVAREILSSVRPDAPDAAAHVFLGDAGAPLLTVYTGFVAAVEKVWRPSRPDEQRPRFHDLRKTGATRVEAVSSHAVAKAFLGHADEDVTDSYIVPKLDAVRDAIDRAARSIDGETPAGAIPFPVADGTADGTARLSRVSGR